MNDNLVPNTTPQDQFREDVLPPYDFYMSDKGSEWKARAAGCAVAHFAEHVWCYYNHHDRSQLCGAESEESYIKQLADNKHCPELRIIWDFALAGKHRFLTKPPKHWPRTVLSSTGAVVAEVAGSGAASVVRLWMPDCCRHFDDVLEKVVSFWRDYLLTAPTYQ